MNEDNDHVEVVEMAYAPGSVGETQKTPGELLRNARFALDLNINDVAAKLYLSKHVVTALENDDYDKLRGSVFARGYLRSYARLVNLPGDDIIEKFNLLGFGEIDAVTPVPPEVRRSGYNPVKRETLYRWLSYGVVFIFFMLAYVWWRNHNGTMDLSSANEAMMSTTMEEETNTADTGGEESHLATETTTVEGDKKA